MDINDLSGVDPEILKFIRSRGGGKNFEQRQTRRTEIEVPNGALTVSAFVAELLEGVPEELHSTAMVKFENDYDTGKHLSAWYERPETDGEMYNRIGSLLRWAKLTLAETANSERRDYERLRAKFETK